jgi:hypothetical protein
LLQLDLKVFVGVKASGLSNQDLGKVRVDPPVADLVGVSQGIARDFSSKAHVIEFLLIAPETSLDISEAFVIGQLSKSHTKELISAGKGFDLVVAPISFYALAEFVGRQEFHELGEIGFAGIHKQLSPSSKWKECGIEGIRSSNR